LATAASMIGWMVVCCTLASMRSIALVGIRGGGSGAG
jgi:hypothetical protein